MPPPQLVALGRQLRDLALELPGPALELLGPALELRRPPLEPEPQVRLARAERRQLERPRKRLLERLPPISRITARDAREQLRLAPHHAGAALGPVADP